MQVADDSTWYSEFGQEQVHHGFKLLWYSYLIKVMEFKMLVLSLFLSAFSLVLMLFHYTHGNVI